MRAKERHKISFILALFMLLSGMCFDSTKADFSLESTFARGSEGDVSFYDTVISSEEICTAEMLGIRNISCIRQFINRSICSRKDTRASLGFLSADAQKHLCFYFFTAAGILQLSKFCLNVVVLNYIHNQDGKKRR